MELSWISILLLAGLGGILYLLYKWSITHPKAFLSFSNVADFGLDDPGIKAKLDPLPQWLLLGALGLFGLAFLDIHWVEKPGPDPMVPPKTPTEGIAIYLMVDRSTSMRDSVLDTDAQGYLVKTPKIDILKRVTKEFIAGDPKTGLKGRPNDLIGLISFARSADVLVPLTLNHKDVLDALSQLKITDDPDSQGTGIGYVIYKTANIISATRHFAEELAKNGTPAYEIKSSIMILVTDGFQDVNPEDRERRFRSMEVDEASDFAKAQNVKLYIVNVDPSLNTEEFQPHRNQMRRIAEKTGGRFYITGEGRSLETIYEDINKLEKSSLPEFNAKKEVLPPVRTFSLYPFLIGFGLLLLSVSIILKTLLLRRIP